MYLLRYNNISTGYALVRDIKVDADVPGVFAARVTQGIGPYQWMENASIPWVEFLFDDVTLTEVVALRYNHDAPEVFTLIDVASVDTSGRPAAYPGFTAIVATSANVGGWETDSRQSWSHNMITLSAPGALR